MPLFDMDPNLANNLVSFGGAMMQNAGQPGASFAGAAGAGVQGMNAAALQRAQTQDIQSQAQSRNLQNQLLPYQLEFMKYRMKALQQDIGDDNTSPSSNTASSPWSTPLGATKPSDTTAKPSNESAIAPAVFRTAQQTGLPPALLHGVYMTESSGNPNAPNGDGRAAVGGMQLHAGAAQDAGVTNRNDPQQNLMGGATYLKQQIDKYGDQQTGVLAYNWGPGKVDNWIASGKDPAQIPQPQQDYLKKVNGYMQAVNPQSSADSPQKNISQGITTSPNLPQNSANIQTLQGRVDTITKKLNRAELAQLPTKSLEENLKAAQDQLAAAMKTQQEVESAGPKAGATKQAENTADSAKTLAAINSSIDTQIQNLNTLKGLSKKMPDRGPANLELWGSKHLGNQDMSSAWADFNTMNKQMFVNGLMGSIPAGSRLDIPIVKSLQAAKEVDPYTDAKSREAVINRHIETLKQAKANAEKNYGILSGNEPANIGAPAAEESAKSVTHIYKPGQGIVPIGVQ